MSKLNCKGLMQIVVLLAMLMLLIRWHIGVQAQAQIQAQAQVGLQISAVDERKILEEAGIHRVGAHYKVAGCDDYMNVELTPVDLNGDGQVEVILRATGSPCFSGMMQSNVSIYVRSSKGEWRDRLGFLPAFGAQIEKTKTKGFADVVLPVLGGCDQVYHWSGGNYYYAAQRPAYEGANCSKKK